MPREGQQRHALGISACVLPPGCPAAGAPRLCRPGTGPGEGSEVALRWPSRAWAAQARASENPTEVPAPQWQLEEDGAGGALTVPVNPEKQPPWA